MFISDYDKPSRMLSRLDSIAKSLGTPSLADQLGKDAAEASLLSPDGILLGSTGSSTFTRALIEIAKAASVALDDLTDESFSYIISEKNPIPHDDESRFAFRFGEGYIAITRDTCAFDARHDCVGEDTTPLDLIVLSLAIKASQRGCYMLVRYNDNALMANPVFAGGNYTEASAGRGASDMWKLFDGMLCEMRSVVLDLTDGSIVSLPFYKFRNLGECEAYSVENVTAAIESASRVEMTDKMDGSFCQMKWMGESCDLFGPSHRLTSMSGSLNPETNETLAFIYEWVASFEAEGMRYTDLCRDNEDWTFIFEFIRPDLDSHIVQYEKSRWGIYLLSARNVLTGETMFYDQLLALAGEYNLPITQCFEKYDLDAVLDICHSADVSEREGFVVNIDGWYVKIKLDEFCAISKIVHGSENFNTVIANVARGTFDDLLGKIPQSYHEPLMSSARKLYAFDADMGGYIDAVVASAPVGDIRGAVAYFNENVPKAFVSLCIDAYKNGRDDINYLYRNPRHPAPSCWREREFEDRAADLASAREAIGI